MLIKSRGIIFRSVKYSETSVISDIYTEEKGLRTYIISGVRTHKAKVSASLLQIMTLVEIVAYHREDREMSRIKEIKAAHVFQSIPFDIKKGAIGMFMIELARKSIKEHEVNKRLFDFLFKSFQHLDEAKQNSANFHLCFMIELSGYLGFLPGGHYSSDTPFFDLKNGVFTSQEPLHIYFINDPLSKAFDQLIQQPAKGSHIIQLDRKTRNLLLIELITYYRLHIENLKEIHAHEILKIVLE